MFKFLWLTTKQLWIKKHRGHKNSRYYQNKTNNNSLFQSFFFLFWKNLSMFWVFPHWTCENRSFRFFWVKCKHGTRLYCRFAKIFLDTSINFNVEILRVLDVFCAKKTLYFARLDDVHMNLFIISEKGNKVRLRWLSETYQLRPRP